MNVALVEPNPGKANLVEISRGELANKSPVSWEGGLHAVGRFPPVHGAVGRGLSRLDASPRAWFSWVGAYRGWTRPPRAWFNWEGVTVVGRVPPCMIQLGGG